MCPASRRLGHLNIRSCWEEMRNLDKALLHHQVVHGTWEQNVSISPFTPQFRDQQGGTKSCELTAEQHVLHLCSSQLVLNKVQLRLGLLNSTVGNRETQNFCHYSKRKESDVSTDTLHDSCILESAKDL